MLYVVQAVKERKPYVEEMMTQIPDAVVYYDEFGDPMKAFLHICENIIGDEPCVFLEDDLILTSNFKQKIEKIIAEHPNDLIKFFDLSKKYTTTHIKKGREFCSNLCVYFPKGFGTRIAQSYASWPLREKEPNANDYLVGYAWGYSNPFIVYCPSLVQHRVIKSAISSKRSSKRQSITFEP